MLKITFVLTLITLSAVSSHITWRSEYNHLYNFEDFKQEFNKEYSDELEHEIRRAIFTENLNKIRKTNSDPSKTYKLGINHFADMNHSEIKQYLGKNRSVQFYSKSENFFCPAFDHRTDFLSAVPKSIDWRDHGVLNSVRNQGACGSCWAFATIAASEAHVAISTGKLLSFSEQQLVDCVPNPDHCGGTGGCEGSIEPLGFSYIAKNGGYASREDYIYKAKDGKCIDNEYERIASIQGFSQPKANDPQDLLETVAKKGPVTISVAASVWAFYESGIFNEESCGLETNHAVTLIGYGEEKNGKKYWTVRNSWGPKWGEEGHIRLHREDNFNDVKCGWDKEPASGSACEGGPDKIWVCGICGMYSESSYAIGGKLK